MLDTFPFKSLAITTAVAVADGMAANYDINHNNTAGAAAGSSPPLLHSKALIVQGASIAAGVIGELANWSADYTEPLMCVGAGLMARAATLHVAQQRQKTPATVQGYQAHVGGAPAWAHLTAAFGAPATAERQPVTAAGQASRQPVTLAG